MRKIFKTILGFSLLAFMGLPAVAQTLIPDNNTNLEPQGTLHLWLTDTQFSTGMTIPVHVEATFAQYATSVKVKLISHFGHAPLPFTDTKTYTVEGTTYNAGIALNAPPADTADQVDVELTPVYKSGQKATPLVAPVYLVSEPKYVWASADSPEALQKARAAFMKVYNGYDHAASQRAIERIRKQRPTLDQLKTTTPFDNTEDSHIHE